MNTDDVKDMAQDAGRKAKSMVQDESPIERAQELLKHADETVRDFAKNQPVMATAVAAAAGYLLGRAIARAT
jgi:ElaB/YqjD/DUF883 family membrane-anchored ribosome-binding protein